MGPSAVQAVRINLEQLGRALVVCAAAGVTVAVWGATGVGKSAKIKDTLTKLERKIYDFRLSVAEPTDLGGTPVPLFDKDGNVEDGYLVYLMANDLMPFKTAHNAKLKAALFMDEYDRTDNPNVKNASLQLIYDRQINGHELVDDCVIVIAGNATYDDDTTVLNAAQAGRMVHLYVETASTGALDSWREWAEDAAISEGTRGFMTEHWTEIQGDPKRTMTEELGRPTPRTMEFVDRLMAILESPETPFKTKDLVEPLVQGCVGRAAATKYLAFLKLYRDAPTKAEILADPDNVRIPQEPGILFSLTLNLCDAATKDDAVAKAVAQYGLRWPEEPAAYLYRRLLDKYPQIATSKAFQAWNAKRMHTQPSTSGPTWPNHLPALVKAFQNAKPLPENDQWVNRVQIQSDTDPTRPYIVAQRRSNGEWRCSCRANTSRGTCKHVDRIPEEVKSAKRSMSASV